MMIFFQLEIDQMALNDPQEGWEDQQTRDEWQDDARHSSLLRPFRIPRPWTASQPQPPLHVR